MLCSAGGYDGCSPPVRVAEAGKFSPPCGAELMKYGTNTASVWASAPTGAIHAANVGTHGTPRRRGPTCQQKATITLLASVRIRGFIYKTSFQIPALLPSLSEGYSERDMFVREETACTLLLIMTACLEEHHRYQHIHPCRVTSARVSRLLPLGPKQQRAE